MYMMMLVCCLMLKLISFHHVMHDNRELISRLKNEKEDSTEKQTENIFNLPNELYAEALKYPNNLNFQHFIRYLLAPTCCF
jgi:hypothetical protein